MSNDFLIEGNSASSDYAVSGEAAGPRFPWLQASTYKPANAKSSVFLGLVRDSVNVSGSDELDAALTWTSACYDDEGTETEFGAVSDDVRWIILARPKLFGMVKSDGTIVALTKGLKERGEVTVSQVLLGCVLNGVLVKDFEGKPQIFTLKLRSSKTGLLGSERDKDFGSSRNGGHKTIAQLNAALVERTKARSGSWLAHTVSVKLSVVAEKFTTADGKEASMGVRFIFDKNSGAKLLSDDALEEVFAFIKTDDFKTLANNPFAKPKIEDETATVAYEYIAEEESVPNFEDVPF